MQKLAYDNNSPLVVVPVPVVSRMAMPVVQVVDMIVMGHGHVSATRAVAMFMPRVDRVLGLAALVNMIGVGTMNMAVVGVVGVVSMLEGDMAAPLTVSVRVIGMAWVLGGDVHLTTPRGLVN